MGKAIIYIFFGLIAAFFLIGPAVGLYIASKDTLAALSYEGRETGLVSACRSKRVLSNSNSYITAPVVNRASGGSVLGTVDEVKYLFPCKTLIGQTVSIRYDMASPSNAQINTFHQMWFMPMIIGLLCTIFYGAIAFGIIRRKR